MMPTSPYISVIIPAYNEAAAIARCLTSLSQQIHALPLEIIVVDNASTDETASIAAGFGVTLIHEEVKGVCAARQAGLAAARGEIIISTDADCVYPPGWLAHIEDRFNRIPDMAVLVETYRFLEMPALNNLLAAWEQLTLRLHYGLGWQWYASAANLAFRRELFSGYNTALGSGGDELYVIRALRQFGRVVFDRSNPVWTSPRRLRHRFLAAFIGDFLIGYLGSMMVSKWGRTATKVPDIRSREHNQMTWPYAVIAVVGLAVVTGLFVITVSSLGSLIALWCQRPLGYLGITALLLGGAAYCTFWPRSQLGMAAPWRAQTRDKVVALTFDDGPNEPYTSQIAKIIESYGGHATFFQCGAMAESALGVTARLAASGHTIGNHTYDHAFRKLWRPRQLLAGIIHTNSVLERATGRPVRFFRSPWLAKTPMVAWAVQKVGLQPIAGQFISMREVWQPDGHLMARQAVKRVKSGAILILHDSRETRGGDRTQTVTAVRDLCEALTADGYRLVSLDELF